MDLTNKVLLYDSILLVFFGADRIIGVICTLQVTSKNKAMRHITRSLGTGDIVLYCYINTFNTNIEVSTNFSEWQKMRRKNLKWRK